MGLKSTSSVLNDLIALGDQGVELVSDFLSQTMVKIEDIGGTRDKVVLGLNNVLEVDDFGVPFFADGTGLTGHHGEGAEGLTPVGEVFDEGLSLSLVLGDLALEDTSGNGVAGDEASWTGEDGSGASTIHFGSHVFSPSLELVRGTRGGSLEAVGNGSHFGLDGDQLLGEGVELLLDLSTVLVTRFKSVDQDFDGGLVDFLAAAHEHFFVVLEGDTSDHLDVLGALFELDGKGLDLLDAHTDVPDGLVEGDHGGLAVFRSVLVELVLFVMELADFLG